MIKQMLLLIWILIPLLALTSCVQSVNDHGFIQPFDSPSTAETEGVENSEASLIDSQTSSSKSLKLEALAANAVNDEKEVNVSKANAYCAFESASRSNLLYVERNHWIRSEMYVSVNPNHFIIDINSVSPLEIIELAEEEFPGKEIYYHCLFKSPSEAAFNKLSEVLSFTVPVTENELSTLKYQSSLYLTKHDIELIQEKDIGNLLMDFDYVDDERYKKNPELLQKLQPGGNGAE